MQITALLASISLAAAGTFNVDLQKEFTTSIKHPLNKAIKQFYAKSLESNVVPEHLVNGRSPYSAVLYVGSDSQKIVLPVDTSQGDLWIQTGNSSYCSNIDCSNVFLTQQSDTYHNSSKTIATAFDPSWFSQDEVRIGNATIQNASFVASEGGLTAPSYLGVSFKAMEQTLNSIVDGSAQGSGGFSYPNIPILLKEQGYIDLISLSLYMNTDGSDGQILFGGIDHSKYSGDLGIVPMVNVFHPGQDADELMIMLHHVSINNANTSCKLADMASPVLLDTNVQESILPVNAVMPMGDAMGLYYNDTQNGYLGSCNVEIPFEYFVFDFSGIEIQVPPSELLEKAVDWLGNPVLDSNGEPLCMLSIIPIDTITSLSLGEKIVRYFYMAFDLENREVALAQAKPGSTNDTDIEPIVSKLPGTTATSYSSTYMAWGAKTYTNYQSCLQAATSTSKASHASTPLSR